MSSLEQIQAEIASIKGRNARVEQEKAWETSWQRKIGIITTTYCVMILVFSSLGNDRPFLNAIIPTLGYMLSTLSMEWMKRLFMKNSFYGIEVHNSSIDNKGVFATKDFKKGDVIIQWDISHKLTEEEYQKLTKEERRYVANINNEYIVNQVPAKFVNHSCDANTSVIDYCDVAIRDIKK